jgi:hypothetical protein
MKALTFSYIVQRGILTAFLLFIGNISYCQIKSPNCNCPQSKYGNDTKADTVFHLSNGKSIALCGSRDNDIEKEKGKVYFSEFVLVACGEKQVIKFWGAVETCQLRVMKDTLIVETLCNLPTGKNMAFKWTVWTIEHIYFKNGKVINDFKVNRKIPKYNQQEIQTALRQYEQANKEITDANMEISDKLFMAAISGNQKARAYLIAFKHHFNNVLDGSYAEWYDDARRRLKLWDTNVPSEDHF